ncbi:MAG: GNAT family N-acetyltransferase [Candidatus Paceibacterota bacterium]
MENVEIVEITPDEWKTLRDLRREAVMESPAAFGQNEEEVDSVEEKEWRTRLSKHSYLFVKKGNAFVGMGCVVPEKNAKSKHGANIYGLYVSPQERGNGTGRKLLEALIEHARRWYPDLIKISLIASATQSAALSLYESTGFKRIGVLEKEMNINGTYVDEVMLVKFL